MRTRMLFTLLLLLALTTTAGERRAATSIDIPYTKFLLPNGLTLIVHEDHKAPIVAVNVWYHVGSKNEKPGKTGFAHLFEHLMFNGTEHFDDDYFKALEKVGATALNGRFEGNTAGRAVFAWANPNGVCAPTASGDHGDPVRLPPE